MFVAKKNNKGRRRKNKRQNKKGHSSGYKLNILDRFTNIFKSVGNFVYKNDTSSYFLGFFLIFFIIIIPLIYFNEIFLPMFINVYSLVRWSSSPFGSKKKVIL